MNWPVVCFGSRSSSLQKLTACYLFGSIRLPADFDDPQFSSVTIQRDLFYGYDTLMENVCDPSHIDFAHHKVSRPDVCTCQTFVS